MRCASSRRRLTPMSGEGKVPTPPRSHSVSMTSITFPPSWLQDEKNAYFPHGEYKKRPRGASDKNLNSHSEPNICQKCGTIDWHNAERRAAESSSGFTPIYRISRMQYLWPPRCELCWVLSFQIARYIYRQFRHARMRHYWPLFQLLLGLGTLPPLFVCRMHPVEYVG